jgi:hypothetical protein
MQTPVPAAVGLEPSVSLAAAAATATTADDEEEDPTLDAEALAFIKVRPRSPTLRFFP